MVSRFEHSFHHYAKKFLLKDEIYHLLTDNKIEIVLQMCHNYK